MSVLQQGDAGLGIGETPIGPTWDLHHYFLGADNQGRDVMARLLYGGRNSLLIGIGSALICCILATILAVARASSAAGSIGSCRVCFDVIWAFPVFLFAISSRSSRSRTASISARHDARRQPLDPDPDHRPDLHPLCRAPIRGEVLSVREKEFVDAAIAQGASDWRLMTSEILPNVITTVIVFFPLMIATTMLTEAALSFLSVGVQPPKASWGTIINDGQEVLYTRPRSRSPRASRSCSPC